MYYTHAIRHSWAEVLPIGKCSHETQERKGASGVNVSLTLTQALSQRCFKFHTLHHAKVWRLQHVYSTCMFKLTVGECNGTVGAQGSGKWLRAAWASKQTWGCQPVALQCCQQKQWASRVISTDTPSTRARPPPTTTVPSRGEQLTGS
jgi:hypothetical protein